MYIIENGIVYKTDEKAKYFVGNEIQYSLNETEIQIIYQWQKFNLITEIYENDTTNITPILGQIPINGQVVIAIVPATPQPTLEDKVNYLYYKTMGVI